MEIYKDLSTPESKEFENLLNSQLSKTKIEEGKLLTGKITKITEKHIYLLIDGMKSEALIDISEVKLIYANEYLNGRIAKISKTQNGPCPLD